MNDVIDSAGRMIALAGGFAVEVLVSAVFISLAVRVVCAFKPPFRMALASSAVIATLNELTGYLARFLPGFDQPDGLARTVLSVLLVGVGFLMASAVFGRMIRYRPDRPVGFRTGMLVSLVLIGFMAAIAALIGLIYLVMR